MFYGPNVLIAFMGAVGFFVIILSFLAHPRFSLVKDMARLEGRGGVGGPMERLNRKLHQAEIPITAGEFLKVSLVLGLAIGFGAFIFTGIPIMGPLGLALGFFAYWSYLEDRRDKRRIAYQEALAEVVDILQEAFAATNALHMALEVVAEHAPEPVRKDFQEITRRLHLGEDVAEVLRNAAENRREMMLDRLVEALVAHVEEGGELGTILRALATAVRGMARVRREVSASQAKIRWEARVVCVAPFIFMGILRFTAPTLQRPFYGTIWGQLSVLVVVALTSTAYYVMERMGSKALTMTESAGIYQ